MRGNLKSIKRILRNQHYVKHIEIKKNKVIVRDYECVLKTDTTECMDGLLALIDVVTANKGVEIECDRGRHILKVAEEPADLDDVV